MGKLLRRLSVLLRWRRYQSELAEEIELHREMKRQELATQGLGTSGALERQLGNLTLAREDSRSIWLSTAFEQLLQDLRFGSRILTRSPGVSATAVLLVALVIGGNTTVFSMAHAILNKPMPGVRATGLTMVSWVADDGFVQAHNDHRVYAYFNEHSATLRPIAAFDFQRATLTHSNGSYAVSVGIVSANYFDTLAVRLVTGRTFTAEETRGAQGLVVILSDELWRTQFAGDSDILDRQVHINGQPATVVGVAEPDFQGANLGGQVDLWVPLAGELREQLQPNRWDVVVLMIGRLAPGVSRAEAQAELTGLWTQLQQLTPELRRPVLFANREHPGLKPRLVTYSATAGGDSLVSLYGNRMLAVFSVVTLLTIAIVCANVANLLIARAVVRQRELALRQSLGASPTRILRSLLAEGLALSVVAWMVACLFAWWVSKAVFSILMTQAPATFTMPDISPDWTVVAYALGLAVVCTVAVTSAPAWRTRRLDILPLLKVGEHGVVQSRSTLSRSLVVLQVAFSVLLLTSAGLAFRSLSLEDSLDVGFETENLLLTTVNTAGSVTGPGANRVLLDGLASRLRALPGVQSVSYVPGGGRLTGWLNFPVRRDTSSAHVLTSNHQVAPGFFHTLGVPFVAGSDFTLGRTSAAPPAIITQDLAEALWPGESALGRTLFVGPADRTREMEVVGIVRDAHFAGTGLDDHPRYIFFDNAERPAPAGTTTFYIRYRGPQETIAPVVARALRETDARVAIASLRTFDSVLAETAAPVRMLVMLLTLFALGSLLIAAIGQYAVVAFDARRRTREFGCVLRSGRLRVR
jgi:macrolide transport system ATP-binding/permease protein